MFSRFRQSRAKRTGPRIWRGPAGARAYAIGDVHGRLDLLEAMIDTIEHDRRQSAPARDYLILLGDLIDRGPDSRGVIERLMDLRSDVRPVFLMGNHEEMMLRVLGDEPEAVHQWLTYGGYEFAQSYGVEVGRLPVLAATDAAAMIRAAIPPAHLDFIEGFADSFTFGDYLFVHAGLRPGRCLAEQDTHDLRWIREEFIDDDSDHGCMVVHGHTISAEPEELDNRIGIDTGAYQTGVLTAVRLEGDQRRIMSVDDRLAQQSDGRI
jgi:serine/threonine protein phosphatase 1